MCRLTEKLHFDPGHNTGSVGPQQVTTAEWGYLLNSELVADTYGDGSPRTVRTTWFLSPVPQKEIDANPLAEYDSLYLFDCTDALR